MNRVVHANVYGFKHSFMAVNRLKDACVVYKSDKLNK